jgi:hypothetical protein
MNLIAASIYWDKSTTKGNELLREAWLYKPEMVRQMKIH